MLSGEWNPATGGTSRPRRENSYPVGRQEQARCRQEICGEMDQLSQEEILWECSTPIGFRVRVTRDYWRLIVTVKHPVMAGRESSVRKALSMPDQVRRSRSDPNVYLFYKRESLDRWVCAVARRLDGDGFLVTTYPTDVIKEGEQVWPK